ncbi:MAG: glycine cleavage T C-terminal barrel domain-containing protein [Bryobacteraceae bacterium]|nr:glycine cleavage T C-terminal barrel domain-containing protein [Bryobacteraceae bacterium]
MGEGYRALRESAALVDLNARGRFRALGEDRARLLHAMSTNHIQQLAPGQGCYTFFLNAQGRILADAVILCLEDCFLLDTEAEAHATLFEHLDRYIIADDVTLEDARSDLAAIGLQGPKAAELLMSLGAPAPAQDYQHQSWEGAIVARVAGGFRIFPPAVLHGALWERLLASGAIPATPEESNIVRLEQHQPRYGDDITDRYLVQETQQLHAIHFSKGCYVGQEIVERVRSRGQVHRLLTPLLIDSPAPPAKGTHLKSGETDAGELTSAAYSPALGKVVAFAYVRAEHLRPNHPLAIDGAAVEPVFK